MRREYKIIVDYIIISDIDSKNGWSWNRSVDTKFISDLKVN
jgi:hypothetical protein